MRTLASTLCSVCLTTTIEWGGATYDRLYLNSLPERGRRHVPPG